jgi:dolichol-phosphate mannosyltransferase
MISIVIPIYNEAEILPQLYQRLTEAAPSWGESFEVILVDDGSVDGSVDQMQEIVERDARFRVIRLSRNFGHQAAISAGLRHVRGDATVIMDGDLQDPPEELPRFLARWREGYEVVYAVRTRRKEGLLKRIAYASFYRFLAIISDIDIPLDSGDFCVMDRKVVKTLNEVLPEQIRFVRGLRAFAGFRQIGVPYERDDRVAGEVKYTFPKLVRLALDGVFGFSLMPLRLAAFLGFLIAVPSFLVGLYFVIHRIFDFPVFGAYAKDTPGLASLAVGLFFLGGVMLIIMGVLGEYIGRIYMEVKRRPTYIIEGVYESASDTDSARQGSERG